VRQTGGLSNPEWPKQRREGAEARDASSDGGNFNGDPVGAGLVSVRPKKERSFLLIQCHLYSISGKRCSTDGHHVEHGGWYHFFSTVQFVAHI